MAPGPKVLLIVPFLLVLFPLASYADVSGYVVLGYDSFRSKSEDSTGNVTESRSHDISEVYNLTLSQQIYPKLRFASNLLIEKDITDVAVPQQSKTTTTTLTGSGDLIMADPYYSAQVGYLRRQVSGTSSPTLVTRL
jgi:hypothetical protein